MGRRKRAYFLLEVMISLALITLFLFPILTPHVYLLRAQKFFINRLELDHTANLLYADIVEKLYKNEIEWADLATSDPHPIAEKALKEMGLNSYTVTYQFEEERHKPKKDPPKVPYWLYLFKMTLNFTPTTSQNKPKSYSYLLFVIRDLNEGPLASK